MSVITYPNLCALSSDRRAFMGQRIGSMLALSLALHFLLLVLAVGLRLPAKVERPLSSYEVSLVSIPTPQRVETPQVAPARQPQPVPRVTHPPPPVPKKVEPPQEKPVPQVKEPPISVAPQPMPAPIVKVPEPKPVPVPTPPVARAPQPVSPPVVKAPEPRLTPAAPPPRKTLDREILRGITLPPEAPTLSDVSPVSSTTPKETFDPTPVQRDINKLLGNLTVPEPAVPTVPSPPKEIAQPIKIAPERPSAAEQLSELSKLNERLQNEYKQKEHMEAPRAVVQSRAIEPTPAPSPLQAAKVSLRNPVTKIQTSSGGPGANRYLLLVQQIISQKWTAPQVDPTVQSFQVIVKFRLYRNGTVREVMVEQTSGNGYFDDAGQRAVLSARLPEFPVEMTDLYLDAHFTFLVGEQAS